MPGSMCDIITKLLAYVLHIIPSKRLRNYEVIILAVVPNDRLSTATATNKELLSTIPNAQIMQRVNGGIQLMRRSWTIKGAQHFRWKFTRMRFKASLSLEFHIRHWYSVFYNEMDPGYIVRLLPKNGYFRRHESIIIGMAHAKEGRNQIDSRHQLITNLEFVSPVISGDTRFMSISESLTTYRIMECHWSWVHAFNYCKLHSKQLMTMKERSHVAYMMAIFYIQLLHAHMVYIGLVEKVSIKG